MGGRRCATLGIKASLSWGDAVQNPTRKKKKKTHEVCGRQGRSLTIRTRNPQDNPSFSANEIEGVSCDYDFCICACCVGPGNHPKSSGKLLWDGHEGLFVP